MKKSLSEPPLPMPSEGQIIMNIFRTKNDFALAVPRLVLGAVFFAHGTQKVLGWWGGGGFAGTMHYFESSGIPTFFAFLAIAAEFFGSIGLILGFLSRIAAFGIACNMVVAIVKVHAANGFFMNWAGNQKGEGFEYHLLVLAIAALVMIAGSGAASIDCLIYKRTSYTRVRASI